MEKELIKESKIIIQYLSGSPAREQEVDLYLKAILKLNLPLNKNDIRLFNLVKNLPFLFPLVDAGSALLFPQSQFRSRILLQLAILETSPHYAQLFLHHENKKLSFLKFFAQSSFSVLLAVFGTIFLIPLKIFSSGN